MSTQKSPSLLVLAYYYAPYNGIASIRINYFVKNLQESGFDTCVVCAGEDRYADLVNSELNDKKSTILTFSNHPPSQGLIPQKIAEYASLKRCVDAILQSRKIDFFMITGGPFFYMPIGNYVRKKYGVSYLLDFRDPWYTGHKKWSRRINFLHAFMERKAIRNACRVSTVTETGTDLLRKRYPSEDPEKFVTIANGFDDQALADINLDKNTTTKYNPLSLAIWGKFSSYSTQHTDALLQALVVLRKKNDIRLYHLGSEEPYLLAAVKRLGLQKEVVFKGYTKYEEGMKFLNTMDVLVLNTRIHLIGTKIYDYIYLNKPILAFADIRGELHRIVETFENGFMVSSKKDVVDVLKTIQTREMKHLSNHFDRNIFSRKVQGEILIDNINACLK